MQNKWLITRMDWKCAECLPILISRGKWALCGLLVSCQAHRVSQHALHMSPLDTRWLPKACCHRLLWWAHFRESRVRLIPVHISKEKVLTKCSVVRAVMIRCHWEKSKRSFRGLWWYMDCDVLLRWLCSFWIHAKWWHQSCGRFKHLTSAMHEKPCLPISAYEAADTTRSFDSAKEMAWCILTSL